MFTNSHPATLAAVADARRQDLLREAQNDRLVVRAAKRPPAPRVRTPFVYKPGAPVPATA
ncbi:MAG: hypothetical protein AVDCRST_MAG73-3778 [uncultured Thermomicrobiales bacterium]|uniref:Uncharacterized protein n=1 Tax=uncultured Thermomicrobiales bacterium TaxID=1645740 RepID=A0A6J4UWE2_9BACT|nr:MAG: hypothetical protein AVDCRST_MAG73-3778 [uncultured Thermomicrobiales bacterium]